MLTHNASGARDCRLFVHPEAVQRTEVFEYAKALGNSQYTLPAFQVYKFIYAATLADMGLLQQASKYQHSFSFPS
jgi:hypothetical protein